MGSWCHCKLRQNTLDINMMNCNGGGGVGDEDSEDDADSEMDDERK